MSDLLNLDEVLPPQLEIVWQGRKVIVDDPTLEQVLCARQQVGEIRASGGDRHFSASSMLGVVEKCRSAMLEAGVDGIKVEAVARSVKHSLRAEFTEQARKAPDASDDPVMLAWYAGTTPFDRDVLRAMPHHVYLTLARRIDQHREAYRRGVSAEDEDGDDDEPSG